MPGGIAPDKPLHKLVCGHIQRVPGDVLDGQNHFPVPGTQVHINPRPGHGVLAYVVQQIVQHPPQQPSVRQSHEVALVGVDDDLQLPGGQLLVVVPDGLVDDLVDHDGLQIHGDIARGRLAGLHQILGQLFQPAGLPVKHQQVLLCGVRKVLLLQQIHVVDDAGQGRLDVMGDVGDEFGLQPLAFQPLLHRLVHADADGVQILGVALHVKVHLLGIQLGLQVPGGQSGAHVPDPLELEGQPGRPRHQGRVQRGNQQENKEASVAGEEQQDQDGLSSQNPQRRQDGSPGHWQCSDQLRHRPPAPLPQPFAPAYQPPADRIAPPLSLFEPGGQSQHHRQQDGGTAHGGKADRGDRKSRRHPAVRSRDPGQDRNAEQPYHQAEIQVQGNPVLPVEANLLTPPPVSCGAEKEDQGRQRAYAQSDSQHHSYPEGQASEMVVDAEAHGKIAAGGDIVGEISHHGIVLAGVLPRLVTDGRGHDAPAEDLLLARGLGPLAQQLAVGRGSLEYLRGESPGPFHVSSGQVVQIAGRTVLRRHHNVGEGVIHGGVHFILVEDIVLKRVGCSIAAGEEGDGGGSDHRPGGGGKKEDDGGGLRRQALPEVPLFFRISHVLLPSAV